MGRALIFHFWRQVELGLRRAFSVMAGAEEGFLMRKLRIYMYTSAINFLFAPHLRNHEKGGCCVRLLRLPCGIPRCLMATVLLLAGALSFRILGNRREI